jgi:hypothetical protein
MYLFISQPAARDDLEGPDGQYSPGGLEIDNSTRCAAIQAPKIEE